MSRPSKPSPFPLAVAVVAVLVSASIVAAVVILINFRADDAAVGNVAAPPPPADADVETRLAWLETEVTRLRREVRDLRERDPRRGPPTPRRAGGLGAELEPQASAAAPEAAEAKRALIEALSDYDPEMRDQLRAVLQEENERLREERWGQRMERRRQRRLDALEQIAVAAKLTPAQKDSLTTLLTVELEALDKLFRDARESGSFQQAREQAQALRSETDEQARDLLESDQIEAWDAMRAEEPGPGRGRRRGPGGGRP